MAKLYGVGVGPGDPELMTLKAVRIINGVDIIAVPGVKPEESVAYKIAVSSCPSIDDKKLISIEMPMTKDMKKLKIAHDEAASNIEAYLDEGKDVACLTIGDPTVYSTYIYIHKKLVADGYETQIINGIPSFCAAAAALNIGLVENSEQLHVIPASYGSEDILKLKGTRIIMKAGKKMQEVKAAVKKSGDMAVMVEKCGMPDEKIYRSLDEISDNAGYYSLMIVKEQE